MSGAPPWVKVYTRDLLSALIDLNADEQHVYLMIILLIYDEDGPIPRDVERVARRTGLPIERVSTAIDGLLSKRVLYLADDKLMNRRAEWTLQDRQDRIAKQRVRASLGGQALAAKRRGAVEVVLSTGEIVVGKLASSMQNERKTDKKTETEIEKQIQNDIVRDLSLSETSAAADQESEARALKIKKTRIPPAFELNSERTAIGIDSGFDKSELAEIFEHFKAHHTANGTQQADWNAAWRSWLARRMLKLNYEV